MELWVLSDSLATGAMRFEHILQLFFVLLGCSRMYQVGD